MAYIIGFELVSLVGLSILFFPKKTILFLMLYFFV